MDEAERDGRWLCRQPLAHELLRIAFRVKWRRTRDFPNHFGSSELAKKEFVMRRVFAFLLCLSLVPYLGCGSEPDTSHRDDPDFVDSAADPSAVMQGTPEGGGVQPGQTPE